MPIVLPVAPSVPKTRTVSVLAMLEKATRALPILPEANESDEIAAFSQPIPTELAKEDYYHHDSNPKPEILSSLNVQTKLCLEDKQSQIEKLS
jgi:hypothetical protein